MKNDHTKNIDRYLLGEMSETEKLKFEQELANNAELKIELKLQQSIYEAAQRQSMRQSVKMAAKDYHLMQWMKWVGFILVSLVIITSVLFYFNEQKPTESNESLNNKEVTTQESNVIQKTNNFPIHDSLALAVEEIQVASSPSIKKLRKKNNLIEYLKVQDFKWKGKDTLYVSEKGVLISVPKNALLQNGQPYTGEAIIEWQEAMDGANIMKAGLSTMADSNLLETQGMFSLRITDTEGNLLEVNPKVGVYVQAPVDEHKAGMQLYDGELDADAIINWVNPVPLEKIPVPVAMSELDFYPKGYEDTLDQLKLRQEKKYRDSLYLACGYDVNENSSAVGIIDEFEDMQSNNSQSTEIIIPPINSKKITRIGQIKGKIVDEANNSPLSDVSIALYRNQDRIYSIASNVDGSFEHEGIESGNYVMSISHPNCTAGFESRITISAEKISLFDDIKLSGCTFESSEIPMHIPPSKVLSFWNSKFDNTLLATREFERRMQSLHTICKEELLDLYIKNIDQPLCFTDSLIMAKGHQEFENYFAERVGEMDIDNAHLKGLKKFYESEIEKLRNRMKKEREAELEEERAWDKNISDERQKEAIRKTTRETQAYSEEVDVNHKRTSRQLGFTQGFTLRSNVRIVNIDREVYQATRDRKTTTITFEGKSSTIQYNDFSFMVDDHTNYERIYTYLLPDKLNSYQRINGKNGVFDYPLNNEITYDVVVLGINETGYFYHEMLQINEGNLGQIALKQISEADFDQRIQELNNDRTDAPMQMANELRWLTLEKENYKVQRKRQEKRQFLERMRKVVFPCYGGQRIIDQVESINEKEGFGL